VTDGASLQPCTRHCDNHAKHSSETREDQGSELLSPTVASIVLSREGSFVRKATTRHCVTEPPRAGHFVTYAVLAGT
jgi:hypothetical protein